MQVWSFCHSVIVLRRHETLWWDKDRSVEFNQPKWKFSRTETCKMGHVSFCSNRLRTSKPQDELKTLPSLWEDPLPVDETYNRCSRTWSCDLISNMQLHSQTHLHPLHQELQVTRVKWTWLHERICKAGWKMLVYSVHRPDTDLQAWFCLSVEL